MVAVSLLVSEFDTWREGYDSAVVYVFGAGTTTLLPIFHDPGLTVPAVNPVVLLAKTDSLGSRYGRFGQPIYAGAPYFLDINTTEQTGIHNVPLSTLEGHDASLGVITATGASQARTAAARASDVIQALDYGAIGSSAGTNTTTLTAAIGAAAARGGGRVMLPPGVIPFIQLSVPQNVIPTGYARSATILQSQVAANAIELTGAGAGLADLTLDGINLVPGSVGLYGRAIDRVALSNVEIKRFAQGVRFRGGRDHVYRNLNIVNNGKGISLRGDDDFTGAGTGDEFTGLDWFQGAVREHTGGGLDLSIIDMPVRHNAIHQVDFIDNAVEPAVLLVGSSFTTFRLCYWQNNTVNMKVEDHSDPTLADRQVISLRLDGGHVIGGKVALDGLCRDVVIEHMELSGLEIQANIPETQILLRDCQEKDVLVTGDVSKIVRYQTVSAGTMIAVTTDETPVVAWKTKLRPNEVVLVDVMATAECINTTDHAAFSIVHAARQPPATLNFDERTAAFTVAKLVKGGTSNASGIITSIVDGLAGSLTLADVEGTFVDNELLTEEGGTGSARVNGGMTFGVNTLLGTLATPFSAKQPGTLTWVCGLRVAQQELQLIVTGEAAKSIVWNTNIRVTRR